MLKFILRLHRRNEEGASAVEYGLLIAGIAAIVVAAVFTFGGVVNEALFTATCAQVTSELNAPAQCSN